MIDIEPFKKHLDSLLTKNNNLSKKALSEGAGLETSTVRKIYSSKNGPSLVTVLKLAKFLNLYPSELFPEEWQKPTSKTIGSLDIHILTSALEDCAKLNEGQPKEHKFTKEQEAAVVATIYAKLLKSEENFIKKREKL